MSNEQQAQLTSALHRVRTAKKEEEVAGEKSRVAAESYINARMELETAQRHLGGIMAELTKPYSY